MIGAYHRLVRVGVTAASAAVAAWVLSRHPSRVPTPATSITIRVNAAGAATSPGEPLFAQPAIDALPAMRGSGPPQLIGIVGRLSAPLAIVRLDDGAIRTLARSESAGGWSLENVAADRATFRRGGETRVSVLPPREPA